MLEDGSLVPLCKPSQPLSSSVSIIHLYVPGARLPFLRFSAFLSSIGSVINRLCKHAFSSVVSSVPSATLVECLRVIQEYYIRCSGLVL
jgi:hypothetical protein